MTRASCHVVLDHPIILGEWDEYKSVLRSFIQPSVASFQTQMSSSAHYSGTPSACIVSLILDVLFSVHRDMSYNKNEQDALFTLNFFH